MKKVYKLILLRFLLLSLSFMAVTASAQNNKPKVRVLDEEEEEEKALFFPSRQKQTGDIETQMQQLQFTKVEEKLKKDIALAKRKRKSTAELESQLERCGRGLQMLRGTDRVTIVDSVVVDKRRFLEAYKYTADLGTLRLSKDGRSTEFETERGNRVYQSELHDGRMLLTTCYMEDGQPVNKKVVEGLDVDGDLNYPFLMTDGLTFYFAARSAEGLGNYDIYVTRYDYDEDKFYKAENVGFPYNSYANDYLMVIDEENKIGWFASDRYQPNGKVCVYTFIPNASRHPYDFENEDEEKIIRAASLRSFKVTWDKSNELERIRARQTLAFMTAQNTNVKPFDFTLVVNDNYTYHYYTDFRSADAKKQCRQWVQKVTDLSRLNQKLETLRNQYASANVTKKKSLRQEILELEKEAERMTIETREAEKLTRNLELQ